MFIVIVSVIRLSGTEAVLPADPKITVHKVLEMSLDDPSLVAIMHHVGTSWILDEVGKNNFVDTLADEYADKPVKDCPAGYVLRYLDNSNSKMILWHNTNVDYGWVRSCVEMVSTERGYFEALRINDSKAIDEKVLDLTREIDLLREDAKYAVRSHQTPTSCVVKTILHDEVISKIKNFDRSTLRKVMGIPVMAPITIDLPELVRTEPCLNIESVPILNYESDGSSDDEFEAANEEYTCGYECTANVIKYEELTDVNECSNVTEDTSKLETFNDNTLLHIYELTKISDKDLADRCAAELDRRMMKIFNETREGTNE